MSARIGILPVLALFSACIGCNAGRHSSSGFRLPADGDVDRGKQAFLQRGCNGCHQVYGAADLPAPTAQPPVPVALGGPVTREPADGYLVTSIINPSHELASYPKAAITKANGESRMPHYVDDMTVRELTDIVAFLQSRYVLINPSFRSGTYPAL